MKKTTILLGWLLMSTLGSAQTTGDRPAITVLTQSDGNVIKLRWILRDYTTWQAANTHGYTLFRTEYNNGAVLPIGEQVDTYEGLADDLKPYTAGQWSAEFSDRPIYEVAMVASNILYSTEWDMTVSGTPSFKDAVDAQQMNENRYFFAHLIADQNFDIAKGMALGFEDGSVVAGKQYTYTLIIKDGDPSHTASVLGELKDDHQDLPVPGGLQIEGQDTSLIVSWDMTDLETVYTSFNIFRGPVGGPLVPANEVPFVFGAGDENNDSRAYYTDHVPAHGEYEYQIVGLTPFGIEGPTSPAISGAAIPKPMELQLIIDSLEVNDTTGLYIGWQSLPASINSELAHFNIYRSEQTEGPFERITPTPLAATERTYTETEPIAGAYYILEAEDIHGHIYQSIPQLGQMVDTDPPAIPEGLIGRSDENEAVQLSWEANQEPDLAGYRLYRCLARGGAFALITDGTTQALQFQDALAGTVGNDSVFYRIEAYDTHGNSSGFSEVLAVPRMDVQPPAKPLLSKAMPTPKGVALGWRYSNSPDVVNHQLQRKGEGLPNWEILLEIPNEERESYKVVAPEEITDISYIDPTTLERGRNYQYQMIALDDMGNAAGSDIITVKPYDSGVRGEITGFAISAQCDTIIADSLLANTVIEDIRQAMASYEGTSNIDTNLRTGIKMGLEMAAIISTADYPTWDAYTDEQFYNEIRVIHANFAAPTGWTCGITLNWSYTLDDTVTGFQLQRSRDGSRMKVYKVLPIEFFFPDGNIPPGQQAFSFADGEIDHDLRYVYKIMAQHIDGGTSEVSKPLTVVAN